MREIITMEGFLTQVAFIAVKLSRVCHLLDIALQTLADIGGREEILTK